MAKNAYFEELVETAQKRNGLARLVASNGREANLVSGYTIALPDSVQACVTALENVEPTMSKLFTAAKTAAGATKGLVINLEMSHSDGTYSITMAPVVVLDHLFELAAYVGENDLDVEKRPAYAITKSGERRQVSAAELNEGIQKMMATFAKFKSK